MTFATIFDVAQSGQTTWWIPAFGLIFVGLARWAVLRRRGKSHRPDPMPRRSDESFVVGDRRCAYSDDLVTAGFHNTRRHGGPIREGLYVRVTYFGNSILRLEVEV